MLAQLLLLLLIVTAPVADVDATGACLCGLHSPLTLLVTSSIKSKPAQQKMILIDIFVARASTLTDNNCRQIKHLYQRDSYFACSCWRRQQQQQARCM
jgi:hypothetical protein